MEEVRDLYQQPYDPKRPLVCLDASNKQLTIEVRKPTRKHMKNDVAAYMKYYNSERLHSANSDETPVKLEQLFYRGAQNEERFAGEFCIGVGSQQAKRVCYV